MRQTFLDELIQYRDTTTDKEMTDRLCSLINRFRAERSLDPLDELAVSFRLNWFLCSRNDAPSFAVADECVELVGS